MASDALTLRITAQTDEFVKKVEDAKTKVRSLTMQMSEIDKQLKTESVDRVQKLSEKLELARRASEMSAKEAEFYAQKIQKVTKGHEDWSKLTDRQKESLLKLEGQMATAQQKATTYAAEADKLARELDETAKSSDNAEKETQRLGKSVEETGKSANNAAKDITEYGKTLLSRLASAALHKGISLTVNLVKDLASAAVDAAKRMVKAVKDYTSEAIDLAADYQDALGYSEQVFNEHAEAVQQWVKDNSVSLRLNISELQDYVNQIGSLYRSFGYDQEKAAELAEGLVLRAADLKAATGKDLQDVLSSLTSVMTGGYKAGYQYGIVINEAAIKAEALASGLVTLEVDQTKVNDAQIKFEKAAKNAADAVQKYGEDSLEAKEAQVKLDKATDDLNEALGGQALALTQAQKEQAIFNLIMKQTEHIAGQNARESGNYKSQLDALKTTFENLKISIGDKLLPVVTDLITKVNEFLQSAEGQELLDSIVEGVGKLANKLLEMLNDGRLEEMMDSLKEKIPGIVDSISDFTDKIVELIPKIADLTEKLLSLFGIETEEEKSRKALLANRDALKELADEYETDTDTIILAMTAYAEQNGLKFSEVAGDMDSYGSDIRQYLDDLKQNYQNNTGDIWTTLAEFASQNNTTLSDITSNWSTWEPQILQWASTMGSDYETKLTEALGSMQEFATQNGLSLGEVLKGWQEHNPEIVLKYNEFVNKTASMKDAVTQEVAKLGPETQTKLDEAANSLSLNTWDVFWQSFKEKVNSVSGVISFLTNPFGTALSAAWEADQYGRASGGPVNAGQMYRINDDHGRQIETFVPSVNGYILDGNATSKIINNSTSSSQTYGDLNVYVNSYGADAATIADEIGAEVNKKLRMAGPW